MPSAPKYLTDQFESDGHATVYLQQRGFTLCRDWSWQPPVDHDYTKKDWDAIDYLIMEWDFGGIKQ